MGGGCCCNCLLLIDADYLKWSGLWVTYVEICRRCYFLSPPRVSRQADGNLQNESKLLLACPRFCRFASVSVRINLRQAALFRFGSWPPPSLALNMVLNSSYNFNLTIWMMNANSWKVKKQDDTQLKGLTCRAGRKYRTAHNRNL